MNEQLETMVQIRTRELHQKVHELEGRDTVQQYLLRVHPLDELLQTVLTVVVDVCGLDGAAYYAVGEDGAVDRLAGYAAPEGGADVEDGAVVGQIESRLPSLRIAVEEGMGGDRGQIFADERATYGLAPVATGSKFFGVLVARRPQQRPFTDFDMGAVVSFAMQAAIGINDCHIHDHYDDIQASLDDVLSGITES